MLILELTCITGTWGIHTQSEKNTTIDEHEIYLQTVNEDAAAVDHRQLVQQLGK